MTYLVRVVAPHFVAGLLTRAGKVVHAAPILRWAIGKTNAEVKAYFARKRWSYEVL